MLCGPSWRARNGISFERAAAVAFVIFQNGVGLHCQCVAVCAFVWTLIVIMSVHF